MIPKRVDEDAGRAIERTKDLRGAFYYKRTDFGRDSWVGIKNDENGFLRMSFTAFGALIDWLNGRSVRNEPTLELKPQNQNLRERDVGDKT